MDTKTVDTKTVDTNAKSDKTTFHVRLRCDLEDYFCVETQDIELDTTSVAEAAAHVEKHFSYHTLLEIRRII